MHKQIVCLGGGIGTVNVLKGLRTYTKDVTVVGSMADDGGSSGRLRKLYHIPPPGDLVSCMAAFAGDTNKLSAFLTYRFPGDRYGSESDIAGQKLGNLMIVALRDLTGDFTQALTHFQKIFSVPGTFLPATVDEVTISAKTVSGVIIEGEEAIDLGKDRGEERIATISLHPADAKANSSVLEAITNASLIVAGPGDLYTNILPVLVVPAITAALKQSRARKLFVVNVANKPYETKGYSVSDYIAAITTHVGSFPFDSILVNNKLTNPIPSKYNYEYVSVPKEESFEHGNVKIVTSDLVNDEFPLYHDPHKLAKLIAEYI